LLYIISFTSSPLEVASRQVPK